ncbi:MAG: sialic acid TRAP transporter substrate-binding protein SiaP [Burkholderiales bacterium]|uniref:sialic acid TRAP transporter substrate-binding protein SiaP n=1 Tax=Casimicrobium huifangae TaxID=2591109 RepID=UPI0012EB517B|nr:sialic acid TRAP transporter substrate-binding protein SiaP [Casimicrobium huifangae]
MNRFTRAAVAAAVVCALYGAAQAQTILRWGDVVGGSHPQVQMIDRVAAEVKAKTGGRVEIQAFAGGQIGGSRDMIEAVANGSQQLVTEGAANFGAWIPSISVVEAPYIWRDPQHLIKALNGPLLAQYNEQLVKARGMRILGAVYYGTRHVTTSTKAVNTLADMKGLKLRVPENDVFKAMAESWGARPTPMNFNELYLALKQGVVDGQENPLPTIKSGKFYEVQKYLVLSGHIMTPRLVVVNDAAWQKIAAADRKAVEDVLKAQMAWADSQIIAQEKTLVDEFKAAGVTVLQPDVAEWRKATLAAVPPKFEAKWGKGTYESIANMK